MCYPKGNIFNIKLISISLICITCSLMKNKTNHKSCWLNQFSYDIKISNISLIK